MATANTRPFFDTLRVHDLVAEANFLRSLFGFEELARFSVLSPHGSTCTRVLLGLRDEPLRTYKIMLECADGRDHPYAAGGIVTSEHAFSHIGACGRVTPRALQPRPRLPSPLSQRWASSVWVVCSRGVGAG